MIDPERATPSLAAGPGLPHGARAFYAATGGTPGADLDVPADESGATGGTETTHISIVDGAGNAVSMTTTLNTSYGTGLMVTGAGFLLNNELDDFAAAPGNPNSYGLIQGEANAVRAFARPLSSMTPTVVLRDDALALLLGSPGGPRIITSVLQTLLNVIDHEMRIHEAVAAPRIHHQWWPDVLSHETDALVADVRRALASRGHTIAPRGAIGSVQAIQILAPAEGERWMLGSADPRRNGCAVGVSAGRLVSRCACWRCD
jgi:gamma-glutamyltranspeptidase/glutathione hydrolase